MIRIANITVQSGFNYQKYLAKQLEQVMQNIDREQEYRVKDIMLSGETIADLDNPLALYTRSGGELFDQWGLSGHLNQEKINTISKLGLGKDSRTKDHIKLRNYTYQSIRNEDDLDIPLTQKDVANGYYKSLTGEKITFDKSLVQTRTGFKKKTDIEIVFTQDATFSYKIAELKGQDKLDAEQMLIDTAIEVHDKILKQYLKDYKGDTGETGYYLYYHNDNRSNQPFSHIHFMIPNMIKLADGTIAAIEIPEMRDQHFHEMIDAQYKSLLVAKWNDRFKDAQAEAYDKDHQRIVSKDQEIVDWRIAYDEESLEKIRNQSKAKELIDIEVSKQKVDLFNTIEYKRSLINQETESLKKLREENKTEYPSGLLIKHGRDHYQFKKENDKSYFITVMQSNGKEKTFWGVDLERAIIESNVKENDFIELDNTQKKLVKINAPVLDADGKAIKGKYEEKEVERATWNVKISNKAFIGKDYDEEIQGKLKRLNRSYENQLQVIEGGKNRDKIWKSIKNKKKGNDILIKAYENEQQTKAMELNHAEEVGVAFKHKSDEEIIESLTNTSPFFTRNGLIMEIAKSSPVGANAQGLADEFMERLHASKSIVSGGSRTKTQEQFTTWDLIKKEENNVDLMRKLFATEQKYKIYNVDKEIQTLIDAKGITPNHEQIEFIKTVFNEKKGQILIGLPGTGKSLAAGWATEIANKHKFRTIGLAPTGKVASGLASDTACNLTSTIDKFNHDLASGKVKLNANDLIFVDESSMVGTKNFNKLLNSVSKANAKLILIGDPNQIQSVSVGNTLNEFLKDEVIKSQVGYLVDIRRQKNAVALNVANTSALAAVYKDEETMRNTKKEGSHVISALEILEANGLIKNKFITTTETVSAIAKDYLDDISSFKEKLIITSVNESIARLNDDIQDRRFEKGELSGNAFKNKNGSFFVGDRVVMEKTTTKYKNGDFGTITEYDEKSKKITVMFDNNKVEKFKAPEKMNLGYATTYEKSQGMTVDRTYIYGTDSKNNNQELFNVGVTRARHNTTIYATQNEYASVVKSWKRESDRVSLITLGQSERHKDQIKVNQQAIDNVKPNQEIQIRIDNSNKMTKDLLKDGLSNIKDNTLLEKLKVFRKVDETIKPTHQIFNYKKYAQPKKLSGALLSQHIANNGKIANINQSKILNANDLKINSIKPVMPKQEQTQTIKPVISPNDIYKPNPTVKKQKLKFGPK